MRRWVSSPHYKRAISVLVAARHAEGLTQRQLAEAIGKPPSFVAKYELGERRLDFVEFIAITNALGRDPGTVIRTISDLLGGELDI